MVFSFFVALRLTCTGGGGVGSRLDSASSSSSGAESTGEVSGCVIAVDTDQFCSPFLASSQSCASDSSVSWASTNSLGVKAPPSSPCFGCLTGMGRGHKC